MKIRIISGSYGLHDGRRVVTMTARSGAFEVEDAEGAALIAAGTAEPCESEVGSRESEVVSKSPWATGSSGAAGGAPSADGGIITPAAGIPDATTDIIGEVTETVDYLTLSAAELRELCDARGIAYKKNASVKMLMAALEQYDAEVRIVADRLNKAVSAATGVPLSVLESDDGLSPAEVFPELLAAEPVEA